MIYQLPNGKIIHITIEEFLDLSDLDIQYLMSVNAGNYAPSPWYGSVNRKAPANIESEIDNDIDYQEELEEPLHDGLQEEVPLEEFPDIPIEED
jgi:hypothetical protein